MSLFYRECSAGRMARTAVRPFHWKRGRFGSSRPVADALGHCLSSWGGWDRESDIVGFPGIGAGLQSCGRAVARHDTIAIPAPYFLQKFTGVFSYRLENQFPIVLSSGR